MGLTTSAAGADDRAPSRARAGRNRPPRLECRSGPLRSAVGGSTAMRPLESCRAAWLLSVLLAGLTPLVSWADSPTSSTLPSPTPAATTTPPTPSNPIAPPTATTASEDGEADALLQQALELERQRSWTKAIELYEDAVKHW